MSKESKLNIIIALLVVFITVNVAAVFLLYNRNSPAMNSVDGTAAARIALPSSVYIRVLNKPTGDDGKPMGSGIIYSSNADSSIIVTANHVLEGSSSIEVISSDGTVYSAKVLGIDAFVDLAVLSVDVKLPPAVLGDSSGLVVGEPVFAIGSPFGFRQTFTGGVISALHRDISEASVGATSTYSLYDVLQTDAAVNPGNSGGMLVNGRGQLIGMNSAIWSESNGSVGLAFAVPVDTVKSSVKQLLTNGFVLHPYIGVQGVALNAALQQERGYKNNHGVIVLQTVAGGPAGSMIGLQPNDLLLSANGQRLDTMGQLLTEVQRTGSGGKLAIQLERNGLVITVTLTVGERRYDQP